MRSRLILLLPLLALAACKHKASFSDEGFARDEQTGATPNEADRYAIYSQGGEIKLGLTDEVVYYRLSDKLLADIDRDLRQDSSKRGGLGGAIAGAVTESVSKMLRHRMQYAVAEIKDISYTDGKLTFLFEDGTKQTPDINSKTSAGEGIMREQNAHFADADVQRFIEAFRAAKQGAASVTVAS